MSRRHSRLSRPAALTGLFGTLSLVLLLLVAAAWPPLRSFDTGLARTMHRWAHSWDGVTQFNRVLSDWVWDPWTLRALCAVVVVWLWTRGARHFAVLLAVTCTVGTLAQQALKALVDKDRPQWQNPVDSAHYAAFPSGHAMTATVACGLLLWLLRRYGVRGAAWATAVALASVSVIGVGLTRIWLGVHWPSDVLGGWLLGMLTVAIAICSYRRLEAKVDPGSGDGRGSIA
ncbi:phosphatase PAP2 family protein [Streptomyces sp. TRM66268-LWL]|uniref:Phosphatase PAP2 family protein n=1 Tax=Streptomyces polyasparticus TaxID=2767826 RepID=A0ABR7SPY9_9ACTN|nr:phosphatase PAP2 family protein [Streptomyces polyasparticus]MBC9717556.1 phosphatase PAP2 family protein [Streptomyces polyasparticus]